jgi:hypothetical protein
MAYDLNAEGLNGVNNTTYVGALPDFNVPTAPPDSTGEPPAMALWVNDASSLNSSLPGVGPVDGTWSKGGDGGGNGVIGWGSQDGTAAGLVGIGGAAGVLAVGPNGVQAISNDAAGIAVVGQNSGGTGVVGWAAVSEEVNIDAELLLTPIQLPGDQTVGVYGCISENLSPAKANVQSGVWGDARNGERTAAGSGVLGTAQRGPGVAGSSDSGAGVTGSSDSGPGGILQSTSAAQLRLVPSSTPLADSPLMQTGQVGDLYLFSQEYEVGTTGTYHISTILWLCIAPPADGGPAVWAQVQLGDLIGG